MLAAALLTTLMGPPLDADHEPRQVALAAHVVLAADGEICEPDPGDGDGDGGHGGGHGGGGHGHDGDGHHDGGRGGGHGGGHGGGGSGYAANGVGGSGGYMHGSQVFVWPVGGAETGGGPLGAGESIQEERSQR